MATDPKELSSIPRPLGAAATPISNRSAVGRRQVLIGLMVCGAPAWLQGGNAQAASFESILAELASNPELSEPMRRREELDPSIPGLERAPIRSAKSSIPISQQATDLVIACEVSSRAVYERLYQVPVWPKGASGLTVGIGYDIGYVSDVELKRDWEPYLPMAAILKLSQACRIKGTAAAAIVKDFADIRIGWDSAKRQFEEQARPRYVGMTRSTLPNPERLNGSTLGALVSLVYNRGASFALEGDRYAEMRNIKSHMASGNLNIIPNELRSMERLWRGRPDMRGVVLRREAEALLFESGLRQKR
jgi:GH24 family phage-related lysozyme (muramidase)